MTCVLRQRIAAQLANGPMWMRSLQNMKRVVEVMVDDDEVGRMKPVGGRGFNMVALTRIGVEKYNVGHDLRALPKPLGEIKAALAERVANGQGVEAAGRAIGLSAGRSEAIWAKIRADLGEQAV